jgi:hypothetical protein
MCKQCVKKCVKNVLFIRNHSSLLLWRLGIVVPSLTVTEEFGVMGLEIESCQSGHFTFKNQSSLLQRWH